MLVSQDMFVWSFLIPQPWRLTMVSLSLSFIQWWNVERGEALQTFYPTGCALKKIHVSSDFSTFVTIDSIGILYVLQRVAWRPCGWKCCKSKRRQKQSTTILNNITVSCKKNRQKQALTPWSIKNKFTFALHYLCIQGFYGSQQYNGALHTYSFEFFGVKWLQYFRSLHRL